MQIEQGDIILNDEEKQKSSKTSKIIIALIIITIIAVIGIIIAIIALQEKKLSVVVDGKTVNVPEDTFIFKDNGEIYVSIADIAKSVGYEAHSGEYKIDVEDENKMYVEAVDGTETASFFLNANVIRKVEPNTTNDYEEITIDKAVYRDETNNKLYVTTLGFKIGFNALFSYNETEKQISIQTLPNLIEAYSTKLAEVGKEFGYTELSEDFNCQKALVYGLIVASRESDGKFGVITTQGKEILSPRYNKIKFVESSGEFIVTNSSNKVGITHSTGKTKITVSWDDIEILDSKRGLYLVKSNNKYGIVNSLEQTIVHTEYEQIGVDSSLFSADKIKNKYILADSIIPVKLNEKWFLLNTSGERILEEQYDDIGYINKDKKDTTRNNALVIGETGTVIVCKDGKYGGIDVRGNALIEIRFDAIYSKTIDGKTTYYILFNDLEYNAVDFINLMKERLGYNQAPDNTDNQDGDDNTDGRNELDAVNNVTDRVERPGSENTDTTQDNNVTEQDNTANVQEGNANSENPQENNPQGETGQENGGTQENGDGQQAPAETENPDAQVQE